ncbi:hypothetical protein KYK29_14480 [Shinella daejeonensis]|uniref:hypothetical protein n=1 Tax=Shinella daejeonensis TaxID=659017 RepID=UPI0020C78E68|nr:hypothetical protein [Shinella daejeonensis]MCP8896134.1 hypothetical protein [Shinella daejeonensis]
MGSISSSTPVAVPILLFVAALVAAGLAFGFVQVILVAAIAASAVMLCAFLAVASSRSGH